MRAFVACLESLGFGLASARPMRWDSIKPFKNIATSHSCIIDVMTVRCVIEDNDGDN